MVVLPRLFLLLACATETGVAGAGDSAVDPSPYLVDDTGADAVASLDAAVVERGVEEVLAQVLGADPAVLFDAQRAAYAQGDGDCPYVYDDYVDVYTYYYWYDSCSTDQGASFDGYSYWYDGDGQTLGGTPYEEYQTFYGLTDIHLADGQRYEQTGSASLTNVHYADYAYRYVGWSVSGDFIWTGDAWGDTWLGRDQSMQLSGYGYQYDSGGTLLYLDGTVGGLSGEFDAVSIGALFAMDEAIGNSCPEPGGSISLHEASTGEWYDVDFQGPPYWGAETFPPECDGCGTLYHRGEALGQVCPDLALLTTWRTRPWS
jgi:hypothetical protein